MRKIEYIALHCTATEHNTKVENIIKYWKDNLKWKNVGYHYLIEANGTVHQLADHEQITNGVQGYNSKSIHVSYIGGKKVDDRTPQQKEAIKSIVAKLKALYPKAIVQGHRDFPNVKKSCPRFDAKLEFPN